MGFGSFLKGSLGSLIGGGIGYLLAPFTGGLSLPASIALGAGIGGAGQKLATGGNIGDAATTGLLSGLTGYGVGSLLPASAAPAIGEATLSASAPSTAGFALPGTADTLANIGNVGAESGLGVSGLPVAASTPYSGGAGFSLPGSVDTLAKIGSVPALTSGGTAGGGLLSKVGKYAPLAIGADYLANSAGINAQQDASQQALDQYLASHKAATEWTPEDRQKMLKAVMGIYSEDVEAAKRKSASSLAERGVGGGQYGKQAERIERQGREAAARSLSTTYGPSNQPPSASAFFTNAAAQGRSAGAETGKDVLNLGGQLSTLYLLNQLFK